MGGYVCGANLDMANLAVGNGESPQRLEEEEESWENEVNMEVFYTDAATYWKGVPATVEGMLGGFGRHSTLDINSSKNFLLPLIKGTSAIAKPNRALDCGAGIGRVTKRLLLPLFASVDMVEQNGDFLEKSEAYLGIAGERVERRIIKGLQEFVPEKGRYDLIWCQWVLAHLNDDDVVSFLRSCVQAFPQGSGVIIVKENLSTDGNDIFDNKDSSVTRCLPSFYRLFSAAGLQVAKQEDQKDWPTPLFPVRMFALR